MNDKASSRTTTEAIEARILSPRAQLSARSRGRQRPEAECHIRTAFQRDRDRIIHSKAFRRLKGKTQVFVAPLGDHYRTRLTHTLEVAQVARTIARALRLNEDLTEAIALGHDLGHTPFGHAGEQVLDEIAPGGFRHNEQSLRVVDLLEREGHGLNLTWEVRDGILNHPGTLRPATLEGQIIKLADRIAYLNHDIDDAIRGQVLSPADLPGDVVRTLGATHSQRIARLVTGVISASRDSDEIRLEPELAEAMDALRRFMFERVYTRSRPKLEEAKARGMLRRLHDFYLEHPDALEVADWHRALVEAEVASEAGNGPLEQGREHSAPPAALRRLIADYLAGMTDRYAMAQYERHLMPAPWPANL